MDRISYIKEHFNCVDYARAVLGWPIRDEGDRTISLAPASENSTALVVFRDWWWDFKLEIGGDVIDLCAYALYDGDKGRAIRDLGVGYHGDDYYEQWMKRTNDLTNKIAYFHEHLRPEDREYLHSRAITDETIERLRIGYDPKEGRLVIPYYKNGYVAYYITRERGDGGSKYKKAFLDGYNENVPWGLHTLNREGDTLVITEGAFDAMSFEQCGYKVLSPISGYFNKYVLKQVISICKSQQKVFLCFDSDSAGTQFTRKMAQVLFENQINFVCGHVEGYKDVSEYYTAGGDLGHLIATAVSGISVLGSMISTREEFKDFVYKCARFIDEPELEEFFAGVTQFPKVWLDAVRKKALKAPPEEKIIEDLKTQHEIRFVEGLGFYEYEHGVWCKKSENLVRGYISKIMKHWATGTKVESILKLLRGSITTEEKFNMQNVFNFLNGVLLLDTGTFVGHDKKYLSSWQVGYEYNPEIDCPLWRKFITEIADENPDRIALLQEMAGYCLFTDNRLQKAFFLIGDGANGKSVLLNVLTAVFGEDNVSNVEMSSLLEPFQRIQLLNSLVNISSETSSNVKGTEAIFKQVVNGERINACYKNQDFITFNPRCKMISAANFFVKSKDTSFGFLRRVQFVKFVRKFTGDKADLTLTDKLMKELPGIFNWVYQGFLRLINQKRFTVISEEQALMAEYIQITNPIIAFIEESLKEKDGEYSRAEIYRFYVEWCNEAGHEPQSRTRFMRGFRSSIVETENIKEQGRGFVISNPHNQEEK